MSAQDSPNPSSQVSIDLNSDAGESFGSWTMGDDNAIFKSVSSANLATGFHAGDPSTMASSVATALENNVTIGAHIAYPDLVGFGRRFIEVSTAELANDIVYQLGALHAIASRAGAKISYVKPHGALYNAIVHHEEHAQAVVDAIKDFDPSLPLLGLPNSLAGRMADQAGIRAVSEAFADRNYNPDGTLVSRRQADAVLHDPTEITQRMIRLAQDNVITAIDGTEIPMQAESICVHGDSPGAVDIAQQVRTGLEQAGVQVRPFA